MKLVVSGLKEAIRDLKKIQKSIHGKLKLLMERLADIGYSEAVIGFWSAQYDGDNDVQVDHGEWLDDHTLLLSAEGESVAFIEFGTGVYYPEQHPNPPDWAVRGEYGKGHGKQRTWGYYGNPGTNGKVRLGSKGLVVLTHGNPPAHAMYDAAKEMRNRVRDIALEVFNQ